MELALGPYDGSKIEPGSYVLTSYNGQASAYKVEKVHRKNFVGRLVKDYGFRGEERMGTLADCLLSVPRDRITHVGTANGSDDPKGER